MANKNRIKFLLPLVVLFCLMIPAHAAQERYALIIGNAGYGNAIGSLKNPANDAAAMASSLEQKGFTVTHLQDASKRQMEDAFRHFSKQLRLNAVGLFFFAGHAIELEGENYLIPIGAHIEDEVDAKYEAVSVGRLLDNMDRAGNGLNLVVLDACRNNPYSRRFRSAKRGLTMMYPASGTMILYATEPGNVAADGEGQNGVFTEHLLRAIDTPGLSVEEAFKKTAIEVKEVTQGKQIPWYEGLILGQFTFVPTSVVAAPLSSAPSRQVISPAVSQQSSSHEMLFWQSVESKPTLAGYKAYLTTYPDGLFSTLAKARVAELEKSAAVKPGKHKPVAVKKISEPEQKPAVIKKTLRPKRKQQETIVAKAAPPPPGKIIKSSATNASLAGIKRMDKLGAGHQIVFLQDVQLDSKGKVTFQKGELSTNGPGGDWICVFYGNPTQQIRAGSRYEIKSTNFTGRPINFEEEESRLKLSFDGSKEKLSCYIVTPPIDTYPMKVSEFVTTVGDYMELR